MTSERKGMTRREFFRYAAYGAGALAASNSLIGWLFGEPGMRPESSIMYPAPGWFETMLEDRKPFISLGGGHQQYLYDMVMRHPVLRPMVKRAYTDMFDGTVSLSGLGDAFREHVRYAEDAVTAYVQRVMPWTTGKPRACHVVQAAAFSFAAVYSPYLSIRDVEAITEKPVTVPLDGAEKYLWFESDAVPVPHLYPASPAACSSQADMNLRCLGSDRTVHYAQHLFLSLEYLWALRSGIQEKDRVTRLAGFIAGLGGNDEAKVKVLDGLGQTAWELLETLDYVRQISPRDENGSLLPAGYFDPMVGADFDANTLGLTHGILLSDPSLTEDGLDSIVADLNQLTKPPPAGDVFPFMADYTPPLSDTVFV